MDYPRANPVPRQGLKHETKPMDKRFGYSHDDFVSFNTQCSSQWDGFRIFVLRNGLIVGHWGHQKTQMYYNGLHHDQITAEDGPIEMGIERINPSPIISYCRMDQIWRHCRTRSSS